MKYLHTARVLSHIVCHSSAEESAKGNKSSDNPKLFTVYPKIITGEADSSTLKIDQSLLGSCGLLGSVVDSRIAIVTLSQGVGLQGNTVQNYGRELCYEHQNLRT